jgi:hypothetical protein
MRSVATAVDLVQAGGVEMYSTPRRHRHQQRASKGAQMALSYDAFPSIQRGSSTGAIGAGVATSAAQSFVMRTNHR